jgi:hypothetical protein
MWRVLWKKGLTYSMKRWSISHDPSIGGLTDAAPERWSARNNSKLLIPYGVHILDEVTYGIDFVNGSLIVFQGSQKNRKTTVVANFVKNICLSGRWPDGWRIAVDLAESGLPPAKYHDQMVAMVATDIIIRWHWLGIEETAKWPTETLFRQPLPERPAHELMDVPHAGMDFKFLRYLKRTETQQRAIELAMSIVAGWPVDVFGPSSTDGNTRNLDLAPQRWEWCIKERGTRLIVYDHFQQLESASINGGGDYVKMEHAVPVIAGTVVENTGLAFIAISQVSAGSVRDQAMGFGKARSRGGTKLAEEANVVMQSTYDSDATPKKVIVEVVEARDCPAVKVIQGIEPVSGLFTGKAMPFKVF